MTDTTIETPATAATMKAVALTRYLPIEDPQSLIDVTLPRPAPQGRDILVEVRAVAVNPAVQEI